MFIARKYMTDTERSVEFLTIGKYWHAVYESSLFDIVHFLGTFTGYCLCTRWEICHGDRPQSEDIDMLKALTVIVEKHIRVYFPPAQVDVAIYEFQRYQLIFKDNNALRIVIRNMFNFAKDTICLFGDHDILLEDFLTFEDFLKKTFCQQFKTFMLRISILHARRMCATIVLQRACHRWFYSPICKDNSIGIVPRIGMKHCILSKM